MIRIFKYGCFIQLVGNIPCAVHDPCNRNGVVLRVDGTEDKMVSHKKKTDALTVPGFLFAKGIPFQQWFQRANYRHDPVRCIASCECVCHFHDPYSLFVSTSTSSADTTCPVWMSPIQSCISASNCSFARPVTKTGLAEESFISKVSVLKTSRWHCCAKEISLSGIA